MQFLFCPQRAQLKRRTQMAYSLTRKKLLKMINLTETQRDALDNLSNTELGFLDSITAGTAAASKAVVLDGSKGISTITSATITTLTSTTGTITTVNATNVDAGASGTAGTVDIFPTTASKGKLAISCTDQTGNTTVGLVAGAMGQATTLTINDPGASAASVLTDKGIGGTLTARCTAQIDATSGTTGTTLTNVTGMSVNVLAAGVYTIEAYISGVGTANSGMKLAIGGTATATSISYNGKNYDGTTLNANSTATTLGNAVGAATAAFTDGVILGTIVVNAAGTLTVQFAQNSSHADTTSVYVNSYMKVTRIA